MSSLTILACQISVPPTPDAAARDANLAALARRLHARAQPGQYDLIILPELSAIEYSDQAFTRLDDLAEPLDGASFRVFSRLARELNTTVLYGFARKGAAGNVHICQAAAGPDGKLLGYYDKLHLAQFGASAEAGAFTPGSHLFSFTLKGLKIAPLICYDIRFPGLVDRLADEGVDLVAQCSAYARDLSFHSWRPFVVTRAMEHGFAWLGLNRAGAGWGGSIWCPGFADNDDPELVFEHDECFHSLTLPLDFRKVNQEKLPIPLDRRSDYEALSMTSPKIE